MSIIRPFEATDIQKFHTVNADPWTATYHNGYYAQYLAQWPELCYAAQGAFEDNVGAYSESTSACRLAPLPHSERISFALVTDADESLSQEWGVEREEMKRGRGQAGIWCSCS